MPTQTKPRRVPRFVERAQTMLNGHPWPAGFTVTVDPYSSVPDAWIDGPGAARTHVRLDPYDLYSADPARVLPAVIAKFKAQARDQRYTEQSRHDDQLAADALETSITRAAEERCPCWANTYALGHDGHCCFVHGNRRIGNGFKAVEDICHTPTEDEDSEEGEAPDSYRDNVDGHWYVCRYDRTAPQIHASDCATCASESGADR